ncbi:arylesterase [Ekhidna sp.]|uniref:arylesterase n=1 Tax=Ekhidna sp. TaxID=2608089 RepID=UPI003B5AAF79
MFLRVQIIFLTLLFIGCGQSKESKQKTGNDRKEEAAESVKSKGDKKVILFYGNSITAGYQLDMDQAFPALIQKRIDSLGLNYQTINAGLSGETSAGGKSRIDWVLRTVPDIFFLELGANDGLRGLPLEETYKNLQDIIDAVEKENPEVKIIIAGMMVPPNLGEDYTSEFKNLFPSLAKENDAIYIPFLLEGVAGNPELNLGDGIHPTPEGHKIVAETVWKYLKPLL